MTGDARTTVALTVVTPVFNARSHVVACLDSVRAQNRDDVEHLIVDGASQDGTIELVLERMRTDPRVRLITGRDRGQSHAMNTGVMAARGDILGCLNVDDRYRPGALDFAITTLSSAPVPSFAWGACEVIDALQQRTWTQYPGHFATWRMLLGWAFEPHPVNPCAYFYHRALHFAAGMFDEREHYALDVEFLLRAASHARSVLVTQDVLGTYVMAEGTKTYTDMANGTATDRLQQLFARYVPSLSLLDRVRYERVRLRRRTA